MSCGSGESGDSLGEIAEGCVRPDSAVSSASRCVLLDNMCAETPQSVSWQMLQKALNDLKNSANELISIEMSMIKIVHANLAVSPEELLVSLEQYDGAEDSAVKKKMI